MIKIKLNDEISKEAQEKIQKAIDSNGGYCPCKIEKTKDNLCMCKDFREAQPIDKYIYCICGLYKKVKED